MQLDFVRCLSAMHDVRVIPLRYPARTATYKVAGAQVLPIGAGQGRGLARLRLLSDALRCLKASQRQVPFDVLHAFWIHEPGFVATRFARQRGIPTVVSVLGGELANVPQAQYGGARETVNHWLARRTLATAEAVHTGSRLVAESIAHYQTRGFPEVIPLGVDCERFTPEGECAELVGRPCLLHVASLVPVKSQRTLLRAFAALLRESPDAHLHIVGSGPQESELRQLAGELAISRSLSWLGEIAHEELPALFRAADLCVLTSWFEQFAMVVTEAAACGRVTVGSAVGILPELVPADLCAVPGDHEELNAVMQRALGSASRLEELGQQLRQRVVSEMSVPATVARHERLYRRLLRPA